MTRKAYDSDLTDEQWKILKPLMEDRRPLGWGRPRTVDTREVVNAIGYLDKTGCQWRSLPPDFPPWPVVFYDFNKWRKTGLWKKVKGALTRQCREEAGAIPTPPLPASIARASKGPPSPGGGQRF